MTMFHVGSSKYKSKLSFQLKTYQCVWGHFILAERVSIIHIFTSFTFSRYTDIFQAIKWVTILFPFPGESNANSQDTNSWSSVYLSNLPTMCLFVPVLATPQSESTPGAKMCIVSGCTASSLWDEAVPFAFQISVQAIAVPPCSGHWRL